MPRDRRNKKDVQERERTTIDEAREEGIGESEEGTALPVPSYTETDGIVDLGVDEPVVPRPLRGDPPKEQPGEEVEDEGDRR